MKFLSGCDPEVFLSEGDRFVSAHGLFPGTKRDPYKVEKGAIQVDGMALEFNIDPANDEDEFNSNIEVVLIQMEEMVKKVDKDLEVKFVPIARFDEEYFGIVPVESKVLGCDPDYGYDGIQKVPDASLEYSAFRTAAGHYHIGWTEDKDPFEIGHFDSCRRLAREFRNGMFFNPRTKEEKERVKYYGAPGSFRPKSYGVELRSPSNLWVQREATRRLMYRAVRSRMEEIDAL